MRKDTKEDIRILGKDAVPHLWHDECGTPFILTKRMEVYAYSPIHLACHCWHRKTYLQLEKMEVISDVHATDDRTYLFRTPRSNLPLILSLGTFKRRPHVNGKWIIKREKQLGHEIKPFSASQAELMAIVEEPDVLESHG